MSNSSGWAVIPTSTGLFVTRVGMSMSLFSSVLLSGYFKAMDVLVQGWIDATIGAL